MDATGFLYERDRTLTGDSCASVLSPDKGRNSQYNCRMAKDDKKATREAFAARLKEAMADAKITGSIRDRATALKLPKSTLEGLENAEKMPGRARSIEIAARLGVREDWLMTGAPPKRQSVSGEALEISHMSPEDQVTILAVWRAVQAKYEDQEDKK